MPRKTASFEEKLEELTGIVDAIGREDCPVDELEGKVRRAVELIHDLRSRLSATEMSVREVLSGLEGEGGAAPAGRKDDEG
jgi:exodeoxyribonuclease VII small subunit